MHVWRTFKPDLSRAAFKRGKTNPRRANVSLEDGFGGGLNPTNISVPGFARLTDHGRLDEAPGVGLRDIRLEHAGGAAGLVHASEHVDLPPADRGCCRMHRFGERADGFPLVGYCVIPGEKKERISEHHIGDFKGKLKNDKYGPITLKKKKATFLKNFEGM